MALDLSRYSLLSDAGLGADTPDYSLEPGLGDGDALDYPLQPGTNDKTAKLRRLAQLMTQAGDATTDPLATAGSDQKRSTPTEASPGVHGNTWASTDPAAMAKAERSQRQVGAEAGIAKSGAKIIKAIVAAYAGGGAGAGGGGFDAASGVAGGAQGAVAGAGGANAGFGANFGQGYMSGGGTGTGGFLGRFAGNLGGGDKGGGGGGGGMGGMKMPSMGQDVSAAISELLTAGKRRKAALLHDEALGSGESDVGGTAVPWAG